MKHNTASPTSPTNAGDQNKQNYSDKPWEPDFSKGTKEITNEAVEGTDIRIVGNEEIGYRATLANIYLSKPHKSKVLLEQKIKDKDWEIIMTIITALIMVNEKYNNAKMEHHASELIK